VPAVDGVSLSSRPGDAVGIRGRNGSGKSTLLKMIAGVLSPSAGVIALRGRLSALLELGAGFDPELTGIENIYLAGAFAGQTREQTETTLPRVLDFAELGEFVNHPVKTYSSGMFVRLAFAVAIDSDPEILIVDEALAVGDVKFQAKCFARLAQLKQRGTTILFVSHSSDAIARFCSRAVLIDGGKLIADGSPRDVNNQYQELLFGRQTQVDAPLESRSAFVQTRGGDAGADVAGYARLLDKRFEDRPAYNRTEHRWGDRGAEIVDFVVANDGHTDRVEVSAERPTYLLLRVRFHRDVSGIVYGYYLTTQEGTRVHGVNSRDLDPENQPLDSARAGEEKVLCFRLGLRLVTGAYLVSVGVSATGGDAGLMPLDRRYDSIVVQVSNPASFIGIAQLDAAFFRVGEPPVNLG
jgi:lipopolysaccharide transport system ATP-binding protein